MLKRTESEWEELFDEAGDNEIAWSIYAEELEEDVRGLIRDSNATIEEKEAAVTFASDYLPQAAFKRLEDELDETIEDED